MVRERQRIRKSKTNLLRTLHIQLFYISRVLVQCILYNVNNGETLKEDFIEFALKNL